MGYRNHRAEILATAPKATNRCAPSPPVFATAWASQLTRNGDLWSSTNERDGLGDDLVPDYITRVKQGGFYGWPWYYLGKYEDPRQPSRVGTSGPGRAGDGPERLVAIPLGALCRCAFYTAADGVAAFPAGYRGDAFVSLPTRSWNRSLPEPDTRIVGFGHDGGLTRSHGSRVPMTF